MKFLLSIKLGYSLTLVIEYNNFRQINSINHIPKTPTLKLVKFIYIY